MFADHVEMGKRRIVELLHTSKTCCHRDRVRGERSPRGNHRPFPAVRSEHRHDLGSSGYRAHRKPTADDLGEGSQIRLDAKECLPSPRGQTKRDDLIEDHERSDLSRRLLDRIDKLAFDRWHSHAARHRVKQHASATIARCGDHRSRSFRIVERDHCNLVRD